MYICANRQGRKARPATYWFSEGFTDYHARALMVRAGLISPAQFATIWNEMLAAYAGSSVRTMPGAQAAAAFWNNDEAQKPPYQRGAMLAAIWNARLRAARRGAVNLDVVLQAQIAAAGSSGEQATSLLQSLVRRRELDIAAGVARYLQKGEPILLPADTFGPCATIVTEQCRSFSRGFDADATAKAGNITTGVDRQLSAYAAGLRNGMKILARTEGEPDNALEPYALLVEEKGKQRTIRFLPEGRKRVTVQQVRIMNAQDPE